MLRIIKRHNQLVIELDVTVNEQGGLAAHRNVMESNSNRNAQNHQETQSARDRVRRHRDRTRGLAGYSNVIAAGSNSHSFVRQLADFSTT